MNIKIEQKTFGSLTTEMGDGVLSYTAGISNAADQLGGLFRMSSSGSLSDEYSSFYMLNNPANGIHTLLHVQGGHTAFKGQGRSYDTRCIYEIADAEMDSIDYLHSPLLGCLRQMRHYDRREFGVDSDVQIELDSQPPLNDVEQLLLDLLTYGIVHNRQLFVRLGAADVFYAEKLLTAPKLRVLLRVIDALPKAMRRYASLGYALNSESMGTRALADQLQLIAHVDDINLWGNAIRSGLILDWQGNLLATTSRPDAAREHIVMQQVAPILTNLVPLSSTRAAVCGKIAQVVKDLDTVLASKQPADAKSRQLLIAAFTSGKESYRHKNVAQRILREIVAGVNYGNIHVGMITSLYPELKQGLRAIGWTSYYQIARALSNSDPALMREMATIDVAGWDIKQLTPIIFQFVKPRLSAAELSLLRRKALPYFYERPDLRCVFEDQMQPAEVNELLNILWEHNRERFVHFVGTLKVKDAYEFHRNIDRQNLMRYVFITVSEKKPLDSVPDMVWGPNKELLGAELLQFMANQGVYADNRELLLEHLEFYEKHGKKDAALDRQLATILDQRIPKTFDELLALLSAEEIPVEVLDCFKRSPQLLADVCNKPRKLSFEQFAQLHHTVSNRRKELPEALFDKTFRLLSQPFLHEWFRNTHPLDCIYVKNVVPACKGKRRLNEARRYVLSQMDALSADDLKLLQQRFSQVYETASHNKTRRRNKKLPLLSEATQSLVSALEKRKASVTRLKRLYGESVRWTDRLRDYALPIALAVVVLIFGLLWLIATCLDTDSTDDSQPVANPTTNTPAEAPADSLTSFSPTFILNTPSPCHSNA